MKKLFSSLSFFFNPLKNKPQKEKKKSAEIAGKVKHAEGLSVEQQEAQGQPDFRRVLGFLLRGFNKQNVPGNLWFYLMDFLTRLPIPLVITNMKLKTPHYNKINTYSNFAIYLFNMAADA